MMKESEANNMGYILATLMGYILGCSNLAYYISKAAKKDIRKDGSGNLGASNATVLFGWKAGVSVALHDICKAFLAALLANGRSRNWNMPVRQPVWQRCRAIFSPST